jgi:glycogen synthase
MVPKKGFDVLIRALADPILQALPIVGVMVGEGDDKAAWQELAVQLRVADRLRWVGNVPKTEIGKYYNLADFLAMPSVSRPADGLNVCVLDAMSCGKPVIGTPVAGNPLAIVDGVTGCHRAGAGPCHPGGGVGLAGGKPGAAPANGRGCPPTHRGRTRLAAPGATLHHPLRADGNKTPTKSVG